MNRLLCFFLSFLIALQPVAAESSSSESKANSSASSEQQRLSRLEQFHILEALTPKDWQEKLGDFDKLQEALANKHIQNIPKDILDPYSMHYQTLELPDGRIYKLEDITRELPDVAEGTLDFAIDNGDLLIRIRKNGSPHAIHRIANLNAVSLTKDNELLVLATMEGHLLALDMDLILQNKFRSPIPIFKIFESTSEYRLSFNHNTRLTFQSRGLKPFSLDEISQSPGPGRLAPVIPRDNENNILLESGDLVAYNYMDGRRELIGIFNRPVIYSVVLRGIKTVAIQSMLSSHVGYTDSMGDITDRMLMINLPLGTKSLIDNIMDFLSDEVVKEDTVRLQQKLANSDPHIRAVFGQVSRDEIKKLAARARTVESYAQSFSENADRYNVMQALASFESAKVQADRETESLKSEIEKHIGETKLDLQNRLTSLEQQSQNGDFLPTYRQLMLGSMKGETLFNATKKPWTKSINWEGLKKAAWITTGAGLATWATAKGLNYFYPVEFSLTLNWINTKLGLDILNTTYKGVPYWQPVLYGATALMMLPVAIHLLGMASVPVMTWMSDHWAVIAQHYKGYGHKKLQKIAHKLKETADRMSPLSTWQRIVTSFMSPYAYLLLPAIHWVDSYMTSLVLKPLGMEIPKHRQQSMMDAVKKGIQPFQRIRGNTPTGRAAGLEKDESMWLSNINPFQKKERLIERREQQQKALRHIEKTRRQSIILSRVLATLVVSQEMNVDPATLVALMSGEITPNQLQSIHKDPNVQSKWHMIANGLNAEILKMANSGTISLENLNENDFADFVERAKRTAAQINSGSRLSIQLKNLRNQFSQMGQNGLVGISHFGVEEFEFLRQVTASPYVARQTAQSFNYDHPIVVALPIFWGGRQDFSRPESLAHDPDGLLWTTDQHINDVFNNLMIHLIVAGPRKALVYQKLKAKQETNYDMIERALVEVAGRKEPALRATLNWFTVLIKRAPDLNFGSYYIYDFIRRFKTFQAPLALTFASRLLTTDQTPHEIWMAYWLTMVGATLYYGWPWTIVERGNQFEEERLIENKDKVQNIINQISVGLRQQDQGRFTLAMNELVGLYSNPKNPGFQDLVEMMGQSDDWLQQHKKKSLESAKVKSALSNLERRSSVVTAIMLLNKAIESRDSKAVDEAHKQLQDAMELTLNSKEFDELRAALAPYSQIIADRAVEVPPIYTQMSMAPSNISTFGLGAVLTTYLAVGLMIDSFQSEKLTFGYISEVALKTGGFFTATYLALSKYMWTRHYIPAWKSKTEPVLLKINTTKTKAALIKENIKSKCASLLKRKSK